MLQSYSVGLQALYLSFETEHGNILSVVFDAVRHERRGVYAHETASVVVAGRNIAQQFEITKFHERVELPDVFHADDIVDSGQEHIFSIHLVTMIHVYFVQQKRLRFRDRVYQRTFHRSTCVDIVV